MLADQLDAYSRRENQYMNNNIKEIQELYKDMEQKKKPREQRVEDKVILIKSYEVFSLSSIIKLSFIDNEVNNLIKYIKFIQSSIQTRLF